MNRLTEEQFATLFSEAYSQLWTIAVAMIGDRSRAEDLVQDAAITGLRRLGDFEPGSNFTAWMGQIVRYNALNDLKHRRRRKSEPTDLHTLPGAEPSGKDQNRAVVSEQGGLLPEQREFDDQVAKALGTLDADRRACLLLRVVHELPYDEIAEIVGVPPGTAMSHVHRAKASLRDCLHRDDLGGRRSDG